MIWLIKAWGYVQKLGTMVLHSRIAQGVIVAFSLIGFYKTQVGRAERRGERKEQKASEKKAVSRRAQVKREIEKGLDEAEQETKRQEVQDEADPRDRFTRDPWA